jgi:hypothetical protein
LEVSEEDHRSFNIRIDPDAFEKRRLVTGPIWMEAGARSFPGAGWTDFPVVILGFWLTNIQPLVERRQKKCVLPFMDGPYSGMIEASSTDEWTLMFVERGAAQRENIVLTTKIDAGKCLEEILNAAKTVVELCKEKQWIDKDLHTLENLLLHFIN